MRKKILSVFLVIFMITAFFPTKSKAVPISLLEVGDVRVTDANKDDILGDGTCSFDPDSNTLTLNNTNITCNGDCIYASSDSTGYSENPSLKIILKGKNYLKSTSYSGIFTDYVNLTIDGSEGGTLDTKGSFPGIYT